MLSFTFVGAGAVGGYFGAMLARRGYEIRFVARGRHLEAIRANGLRVVGPLGDFTVRTPAESDPARLEPSDVVVLTVKTYDNHSALPIVRSLAGPASVVLTLQNGVDSADEVSAMVGRERTLAGAAYIAAALEAPGVIRQTGTHRRIVFGECFEPAHAVSARVAAIADALRDADIDADAVEDARPALWEKFAYLAPFAAFTGAARLPFGPLWADEETRRLFLGAVDEVETVGRACGVVLPDGHRRRLLDYANALDPSTRSSLLIDLQAGKPIEVEALQGSVVRRGRQVGVQTPVMAALYAVLKPHAAGPVTRAHSGS